MTATYHLTVDELRPEFIDQLKQMFSVGQVTITVDTEDETDYLLRDPANKDRLIKAIKNVEEGKVVEVDFDSIVRQLAD